MIALYTFLMITTIELVVIILKIKQLKEHIQIAKEIGVQTRYAKHINKLEKLLIRIYINYKGMFIILGFIVIILNLIVSSIVHMLYNSIEKIIHHI